MTTVLGIDTAGPVVGACIVGPGLQIDWSERVRRGADTALLPEIANLMRQVGHIDLVSVSIGPGAFTGLRVGVAAALGVAVSREIPVVCVSSLEARAAMVPEASVLALLDARKSRVYAQWFDCSGALPVPLSDAVDEPIEDVFPARSFIAVGEGALLRPELVAANGGRLSPCPDQSAAPFVAHIGSLRSETALAPSEVALAYLRDADAQKPKPRVL